MSEDNNISTPNLLLEWFLMQENTEEIKRFSKKAIFEAFDMSKTEEEIKIALILMEDWEASPFSTLVFILS